MALRVGRIDIPSTADRNLQALAREYMTLWNILRPMTTVEYRLDFHLKPDDAEYAMILYELLDDFSKKINDCDDIMLKLVELCWKYSCFDKPIVRDMLNYHSKLVLDASEIICNPEPCHPGLEYLPIDENDTTLDELKDRWRKKSIVVLKLIDTAYRIGEMFPIVPETERIQRDRFRNIANCFKMCNDKIMKLMVYAGVAPFRQGLLRRHLELRTEFLDYKRWFGYSYKFNRVEAELDFFPEWEDIPEPALTRQCIEEFFEVTTTMFLLNKTLQEYKCRYPMLRKRLCDQYLQGLQKMDASLEQLRCSAGATEPSVMSLTQLRNAIPIPPKYVWYAKIDFGLFGTTRWAVEQFSRMSLRWSI